MAVTQLAAVDIRRALEYFILSRNISNMLSTIITDISTR